MMRQVVWKLGAGVLGLLLLAAGPVEVNAVQVEVKVTGVSPGENRTIHVESNEMTVRAGIYQLEVDGVPTDSFCIDINQFAPTGNAKNYEVVELTNAPDPGVNGVDLSSGGQSMTGAQADRIGELWGAYYSDIKTETDSSAANTQAADLQMAIWKVLYGASIFENGDVPAKVQTMLDNVEDNDLTKANLIALSNNESANQFQDYVIAQVPDGGMTVILLGMALGGLGMVRRKI